jgi:thiol-disulfide isomerase/thioredoxin
MKQLILLISIVTLTGCFGTTPQKTGKEGKPIPEFSMLLTDSTTRIHTANIPAGRPFVLFYFSPYCPHCKKQTKRIVEDMDRLKDIHFYFISSFPLAAVKGFYKEYQLAKYPNITTGLDSARFIHDYFEIPGFPYIAVYGSNKKLNKTFLGEIYSSQLIKVAEE